MKSILILFAIFMLFISCEKEEAVVVKVTPLELLFDDLLVGETATKSFTIYNKGEGEVEITKVDLIKNRESYRIKTILNLPIKLKSGKRQVVEVVYTAQETDRESGAIELLISGIKETVVLKTIPSPKIKVSHETINFEFLSEGEEDIFELTISNIGTSELKFEGVDRDDENKFYQGEEAFRFGKGTSSAFEILDKENIKTLAPYTLDDNGNEVYNSFKIRIKYTASGSSDVGTLVIYNNSVNSPNKKIISITTNPSACNLIVQPNNPNFLDFGERPINLEETDIVLLANAGSGKCKINDIYLTESSDSEFTIDVENNPNFQEPFVLAPSDKLKVFVHFKPTQNTGVSGAVGAVVIKSSFWETGEKQVDLFGKSKEDDGSPICLIQAMDGSEPVFEVEAGQIEAPNCIRNDENITVCSNVQMKSASYDPRGENITLTWRMVESPAAYTNPSWITPLKTDKTEMDFYVPYATPPGTKYLVELNVKNTTGLESSCTTEIYGKVTNRLHIELFWDNASDVDLHLLNPEEQNLNINNIDTENHSLDPDLRTFRAQSNKDWWSGGFSGGSGVKRDCYFSNCKGDGIEWGAVGSSDNPRLDRDDVSGSGPENINISKPQEGWYRVSIHYSESSGAPLGTDAHVRVYCNGVIAYQKTAFLLKTDYWWFVGDIFWKSLGEDGICYLFNDGKIYDAEQGHDHVGYVGNLIDDVEPDQE